ncbi:MAG: hypothetical protein K2P63_08860 [Lachnospiraceae bacterium]|nr:hypothetical protein [Lachnospiraceae bacterium]
MKASFLTLPCRHSIDLYIIYDVNDIESLQDYAFIRGQIQTFEQMEQYKVYEDERYVCYDATDLFYTDLR